MSEAIYQTKMIVRRLISLLRDLREIQCSQTQARRWLLEGKPK